MSRVAVNPEVIHWARKRSLLSRNYLERKFPKLSSWEQGELQPTFKQLETFARATRVPFGYLFLPEPPPVDIPISDFRTLNNQYTGTASPELLDTIQTMQLRQAWLRENRIEVEGDKLAFVGSARLSDDPAAVGREMRRVLELEDGWAERVPTWQAAVGLLRTAIEETGVMAVINGVVGNNTHRRLDVAEFRGFALSDEFAPLLFVNGADAKSAQMFTLAHELAHLWLGSAGTGVSGFTGIFPEGSDVELFCDRAAAEFLVPGTEMRARWPAFRLEPAPFERLARAFKVSPIVAGRRAMDLRLVDRRAFFDFYEEYNQRDRRPARASGGDFYKNQNVRVGKLFSLQVIQAAKEGRIGFKHAYELTGLHAGAFQEYASRLGVVLPL